MDALRWCPDCEVLARGLDRCWNCGRPFDADEDAVERMKDLIESNGESDGPPEPDRDMRG
ncbi:MAG: hypothetical protein ACRDJO_11575 [Actinomycetota bacterium]